MSEHADTILEALTRATCAVDEYGHVYNFDFPATIAALAALEADLAEARRQTESAIENGAWNVDRLHERIAAAEAENARLKAALEQIAAMPTSERNPDGDEQAAHSMQLVAQETLVSGSEGDTA